MILNVGAQHRQSVEGWRVLGIAIRRALEMGPEPLVDSWLRFAPAVQARYEEEHSGCRIADLRVAIYVGLVLYNVYNFTSAMLVPDVLWMSVAARLAVVTPASLALAWAVGFVPPTLRERLVLAAVLNAYMLPVLVFWATDDPLGNYTFSELLLVVVFANMLLGLRFRHAAAFTAAALALATLVVFAKTGLDASLRVVLPIQVATACAFSLFSNHRMERRRCADYVVALEARLQAEAADTDKIRFRDLSRNDPLTQLPNRRHFNERIEDWLAVPGPVALLMVDVDHFKAYNDTLGHPAGDECLRRVGQALTAFAQSRDVFCARYGGEEFTLLLRDCSTTDVARLAEEVLHAIRGMAIPHRGRPDGVDVVTVSIGAFSASEGTVPPDRLVEGADRALYRAKRQGRDNVVIEICGVVPAAA